MQSFEIGTGIHAIAGFGEPGKPFRQTIRETAQAGYDHILLLFWEQNPGVDAQGDAPQAFVNVLKSDLLAMQRTIARHGLHISAIYPGFGLFDLVDTQKTIDQLLRYRDIAWSLGCHRMVHCTGQSAVPTAPLDDGRRRDIEALAKIMDAVSSDEPGSIFKMGLDIHYYSTVETIADCDYFVQCSSKTSSGFCLNMGHLTTSGQPGWTLIEKYPERIHVMAWKDHIVPGEPDKPVVSTELGKGVTPFEKYLEVWKRVPTDALQIIAAEDIPHAERLEILARSRETMRKLFAEKLA